MVWKSFIAVLMPREVFASKNSGRGGDQKGLKGLERVIRRRDVLPDKSDVNDLLAAAPVALVFWNCIYKRDMIAWRRLPNSCVV